MLSYLVPENLDAGNVLFKLSILAVDLKNLDLKGRGLVVKTPKIHSTTMLYVETTGHNKVPPHYM